MNYFFSFCRLHPIALIKINQDQELMRQLAKTLLQRQYSQLAELKRSKQAKIVKQLKQALSPTFLSVEDTTLGANSCGSMYKIIIQSPAFVQKTKVEQHKLVAEAIKAELPNIHGYNLKTRVSPGIEETIAQIKIEEAQ